MQADAEGNSSVICGVERTGGEDRVDTVDGVDVADAHETTLLRQLAATKSTPSTCVPEVARPPGSRTPAPRYSNLLLLPSLAIPRMTL
jgi:hypothetical protein